MRNFMMVLAALMLTATVFISCEKEKEVMPQTKALDVQEKESLYDDVTYVFYTYSEDENGQPVPPECDFSYIVNDGSSKQFESGYVSYLMDEEWGTDETPQMTAIMYESGILNITIIADGDTLVHYNGYMGVGIYTFE